MMDTKVIDNEKDGMSLMGNEFFAKKCESICIHLFHTKKAAYQPEADSRLAQAYSPKRANSRAPEKRRVLMRNSSADV